MTMQCSVCKNDDQLSNLVSVGTRGYAHPRCIEQHNKTVAKNLRALDSMMIVDLIHDCDRDPTDSGSVREFLQRGQHQRLLLGKRCPTVDEIVAAGYKKRDQNNREWLFERLEKEVRSSCVEEEEAF